MTMWTPDPTFYPSPRMAMKAPAETLAYVAAFDPNRKVPDGIAVVDVDPGSASYSKILNTVAMPNAGDELHHFGWNACSSCLCPNAPHPHIERRYLVVPGLRSSRIHILDTKPDPRRPAIIKVVEPRDVADRAGYTRPHTVHCGPEGIYVAALGNREGKGPGGVFLMDHETFDVLGQWEMDRGPQQFAYDAWWHLGHDTLVTSEWGTPDTFEDGLIPEVLLGAKYGRRLHFWDLHARKHLQDHRFRRQVPAGVRVAAGARSHQSVRLRQLRNKPREPLVLDLDLVSRRRQMGRQEGDRDTGRAADPEQLPPMLKGFKACPPLVTDIDLSMDDRFLYVACWGTGDMHQYDVSDPFSPKLTGKVRIGGIVARAGHPSGTGPLNGGPQMVEISRDGRRVYFTNSLYGAIDPQSIPTALKAGWSSSTRDQAAVSPSTQSSSWKWPMPHRPHQIRLEGGDCSSDSYCYP